MTNLISVPDDLLRRAKEKALVKEEDWTQVVAETLTEILHVPGLASVDDVCKSLDEKGE